jgi:hypothetical protein
MKLLLDNNKTFSWNKTIIDFGIGLVNITPFQVDKSRSQPIPKSIIV